MAYSEEKLQPKLNGTGTAELIERIKRARPKIASSKTPPQHLDRLAELRVNRRRITEVPNGWPKVRMIQNIEHFSAELQFQRLVNDKLAMHCKIPLSRAKSTQGIPRQVSLTGGRAWEIDSW